MNLMHENTNSTPEFFFQPEQRVFIRNNLCS